MLFDSLWRAAAYCLHPRVVLLSLLPLALMAAASFALGYFYWEPAVAAAHDWLAAWAPAAGLLDWAQGVGFPGLRAVLAPLLVVLLATPVVIVATLIAVAVLMTPAMLRLVATRRFPGLERRHGGSVMGSVVGAVWATVVALLALLVSIPLWFIPPLVLVVPPLIWGWLSYRVMGYDVLAEHASADERRALIARHRMPLLAIGVVTGYLGAAPSLLWASGALFVVLAPVLVPLAVWIYTLVFAFSSLWFAHYALAALAAARAESATTSEPTSASASALESMPLQPATAVGRAPAALAQTSAIPPPLDPTVP